MKPSPAPSRKYLRPFFLLLLLFAIPFVASAQEKKPAPPPPPPPKKASAPAPKPAAPSDKDEPADKPESKPAATRSGSNTTTAGANKTNTAATTHANARTNNPNRTNNGKSGTNRTASKTNRTTPAPAPVDPRAPTGLNLRTSASHETGAAHTNSSSPAGAAHAPDPPGTTRLANGGTKTLHADGSTVERNRSGKLTAVTTAKGATAKMDAQGKVSAIRDGKGTTISRGPHGERRIETMRADHTRLVSNGRHGGYAERHITRGGHEYAQRTYYVNGRLYSRLYAPYYYLGYPYYGYVPGFYYDPAFYGWAYNPWPSPVAFAWGWSAAPWYASDEYYFTPYAVYPAPAFWLADYALSQNLQAAAEDSAPEADSNSDPDSGSGSLNNEPAFVYASAHMSPQPQSSASPLVSSTIKDQLAEEVKQIIADEKDAAQSTATATPAVPPSLDSRFPLFIVSSALSLDASFTACSLTPGDIIRRKDYSPDAQGTLAIEVAASKTGDCPVGTSSRLKLDDLEEMHDNLRQKVDDGLKSLSESQGKGGIPSGPAANPKQFPDGQADPDPTVADALKKQQEAADQAEKDVQAAASSDTPGSAD